MTMKLKNYRPCEMREVEYFWGNYSYSRPLRMGYYG